MAESFTALTTLAASHSNSTRASCNSWASKTPCSKANTSDNSAENWVCSGLQRAAIVAPLQSLIITPMLDWLIVLWANKLVIALYFFEPCWLIAQCLLGIIINPIASNYKASGLVEPSKD